MAKFEPGDIISNGANNGRIMLVLEYYDVNGFGVYKMLCVQDGYFSNLIAKGNIFERGAIVIDRFYETIKGE